MDTLLFGNGINIQFGGVDNLNKSIILRAIRNTKEADFPKHIIVDEPELILSLLGYLFLEVRAILSNQYDKYAFTTDEKFALNDFIRRYGKYGSLSIPNIGFEDYYLIYDLFCYKKKIINPEKYYIREALKAFFLYSIYNQGKVNEIYKHYPASLKKFFAKYDYLFTTNYDRNVETFAEKNVNYLHGAFHIKADVYNQESLRNKLSDSPMQNYNLDEDFYYLYSNALTTYCGNSKLFVIKQGMQANEAVEKMACAYQDNPTIKKSVDEWENDTNELVRKLSEATKLKCNNPELQFSETYPIKEFESISGNLTVVGLSPNNDTHIFKMINDNPNINEVNYYFYDKIEKVQMGELITNHTLNFFDVRLLWREYK
ncbi:hypothetical protein [Thermicanus aegyptius]|uniref:hypothetical protein n=1 Tax=Thermicanus aegyptius TaxID=94009 RepID=UPI0003F6616F|nr:hypothetical protein [Thermicanus aegyptius]